MDFIPTDDDDDFDVVMQHHNTVMAAVEVFILRQQQLQQAVAVLAMLHQFGVVAEAEQLSLEALILFHEMLTLLGHNWRGSNVGRAANIDRGREAGNQQLLADYFNGVDSVFNDTQFHRQFRMDRDLFLFIVDCLEE